MSIKTRIAALTLAALVATGSIAATVTSAEARDFHGGEHGFHEEHGFHDGWGRRSYNDGFNNDSDYYSGYGFCRWVPRFDIDRNYIGRVRSCSY
jgi:hypothetical protein